VKFEIFSEREGRKKGQLPLPPANKTFSEDLRQNLTDIFDEAFGTYYVDRIGVSWENRRDDQNLGRI
jgi:hypothetical protein